MSFLHKLWDETLAGPAPETGLGKLRKCETFSATRPPPLIVDQNDVVPITRSITILRGGNSPFRNSVDPSGYTSESPTGSTPPLSPFSPGTPSAQFKRNARKKLYEEALQRAEPRRYY